MVWVVPEAYASGMVRSKQQASTTKPTPGNRGQTKEMPKLVRSSDVLQQKNVRRRLESYHLEHDKLGIRAYRQGVPQLKLTAF
jgi:hypothetical protein